MNSDKFIGKLVSISVGNRVLFEGILTEAIREHLIKSYPALRLFVRLIE